MLKQRNIKSNKLITIWGNTYGCTEQYRYATALYLISMLSQAFYVIIYRVTSELGHVIEVVDGLNTIDKSFIFQLMATFQLPGAKKYYA